MECLNLNGIEDYSISVLMAVYFGDDCDKFNNAISSIWDSQTLKPREIIIVQDGPISDSLSNVLLYWLNKLGHTLIIVKNEKCYGLSKSLNVGIEYCSCAFIARMDSDDVSLPNRFKEQIEFLNKNPEIDVLGGAIEEIDSKCNVINKRIYPDTHKKIREYLYKGSPMAHPTVMFRRHIFDKGIRYSERFKTSQDIELWFRLMELGFKFSNLDRYIYRFTVSDEFYTRRSKEKAVNEFIIYISGIRRLYGYSAKLAYPFLRLLFRFSPKIIVKVIYKSNFRKKILR